MKNKQKRAATIFSHSFLSFSKMEMKLGKDDDDEERGTAARKERPTSRCSR